MNYAKEFQQKRKKKSQYLGLNNLERTRKDISYALESCESVFDIDEYVCRASSRKATNRKIIVTFFDYLEKKSGEKVKTILREKRFYDYPFERQLEIAKFLHEPHTLNEIEERFDISEETRKKDIRALEEGIEVLGATIRIKKERKNRKDYYKSTMHPVFLPLNLTEVYALTTYLDKVLDSEDQNTQIIRDITERIKSQLSEYALNKLYPYERHDYKKNSYVDDESLARQRNGIRMYLMKSGQPCRFFWNGQEYSGRLKYDRKAYIELESGEKLDADPMEVDFIIESLEYK